MTFRELDTYMMDEYWASPLIDHGSVYVYVNPQTQARYLVEVIDGRPTVYTFHRNLEEGK